jgi:hypothetical protein
VALACQDRELARRGLRLEPSVAGEAATEDSGDEGGWVSAGTFRYADEAQMVISLLQSAGIPAELESFRGDYVWLGSSVFKAGRVLVPEGMFGDAQAIIESAASEEERSAREAADPLPEVITARYEGGVFKPLEPVELKDGTEVEIHLPL